jgi:hypothetical protein
MFLKRVMEEILAEFKQTIVINYERLAQISEAESAIKPAPGKWSKKEIVGHLIDSASNNHQRFVRVQLYEDLDLPGYEQEHWVALQDYQNAAWAELLVLWKAFNEHLLRIITLIPEEKLAQTFRIASGEPVTLGYWVEDYLRHMQKHLRQILG